MATQDNINKDPYGKVNDLTKELAHRANYSATQARARLLSIRK